MASPFARERHIGSFHGRNLCRTETASFLFCVVPAFTPAAMGFVAGVRATADSFIAAVVA